MNGKKKRTHLTMDVIVDQLRKNNVNVDRTILSQHINYILHNYKDTYNDAASRLNSNVLFDVFYEMSVNSVGRVMAYLALVYRMNISREDTVRKAVRLVVPVLRNIARVDGIPDLGNIARPERSFIRTLCSSVGYTLMHIS